MNRRNSRSSTAARAATLDEVVAKPIETEALAKMTIDEEPATNNDKAPEPDIAAKTEDTTKENETRENEDVNAEGGRMKKLVFGPKKPLNAAQRREKKAKQNRRLRKLLTPKNALIALNELKKGQDTSEYIVTDIGNAFTAEIVINNVKYVGEGPSKAAAKMKASEKALRDVVITQMTKVPKKPKKNDGVDGSAEADADVDMASLSDCEDVPMQHLASFALHKLFTEWQAEGYEIPDYKAPKAAKLMLTNGANTADTHTNDGKMDLEVSRMVGRLARLTKGTDSEATPARAKAAPKILKTMSDLPADAATRHPSSLLAFMRPNAQYQDLGVCGQSPSTIFSFNVAIDDKEFLGKGRSKKAARKAAASVACFSLFGVQFVEEATPATNGEKPMEA